jgi:hypothetical protein
MLWSYSKADWQNRKVAFFFFSLHVNIFLSYTGTIINMFLLLCSLSAVNKDELLQMVRFGAEMVFSSKDSTITDEDIDRIIARGEEATAQLDAKMKKFTEDAIKFKMDDSMTLHPSLCAISRFSVNRYDVLALLVVATLKIIIVF